MDDKQKRMVKMLDEHREGVIATLDGLTKEQTTERLVPSVTTLLGIVSHLAYVERWWFRDRLMGEDVELPWSDENPDAEFQIAPGDSVADIVALYRSEIALANANIESRSLGDFLAVESQYRPPEETDLFWLLLHMIEETAQHRGQAEILREQLLAR